MSEEPTGYILVNDRPMPFWLPEGMLPEDIGARGHGRGLAS